MSGLTSALAQFTTAILYGGTSPASSNDSAVDFDDALESMNLEEEGEPDFDEEAKEENEKPEVEENDDDDEDEFVEFSDDIESSCEILSEVELNTEEAYLEKAKSCFDAVWNLYTNEEDWIRCNGADMEPNSAIVESKTLPKLGKIYKVTATIDIDPTSLFEEMYYNLPDSPQWNPTVLECRMIQAINDCTDVFYSVAAEGGGGIVAARDFVNLRQWVVRDGVHFITGVSCEHPDMPIRKEYVRAENRPGGIIIEDVESDLSKCKLIWLLNTDLKGWIPKTLVDTALSGVLIEFCKHLRLHCEELVTNQREARTDLNTEAV